MNFLKSLPGPIGKFFRYREHKTMKKASALFVMSELVQAIDVLISESEWIGEHEWIGEKKKEILKFELIILSFWFLQAKNIFPADLRDQLYEEMHDQYFEVLRKHGYNFKMRQKVAETINARYRLYWEIFNKERKWSSKLGVVFAKNLANGLGSEPSALDVAIPTLLLNLLKPKFEVFAQMLKAD